MRKYKEIKKSKILYIEIAIVIIVVFIILGWQLLKSTETPDSVYLKIDCAGEDISNTYKIDDTFSCELLGKEYTIKLKNIEKNKIILQSSSYGLYPKRENGSISLLDKIDEFKLQKNKELVLALQVTDLSYDISIIWE